MNISVTNISSEETNKKLSGFSVALSDALNKYIGTEKFGVDCNVILAIVSVEEDCEENLKYCKISNKSGSFIDPGTAQRVKYLSLAIPYPPSKVIAASDITLREILCEAIVRKITHPELKPPKGFEYDRFSEQIKLALQIFGRADFDDPAKGV